MQIWLSIFAFLAAGIVGAFLNNTSAALVTVAPVITLFVYVPFLLELLVFIHAFRMGA